ncbi:MAG TPA: winged helix-turn-helix domain-containing protein [Terracidiphilus sp.]|jgi:DNA-binding winged helix-turn-helix (wHTH) protein/TolB-like protein
MAASPEIHLQDSQPGVWQFANCEFDDLRYELKVNGQVVELERKPLELLRHLLSRSGEVFRKEELLEAVWPGVLVVDASLATAVSKLRKVLGEQQVVQTVSRVGYRIAVPATRIARPAPSSERVDNEAELRQPGAPEDENPIRGRRPAGRRLVGAGTCIVLLSAVSIGFVGSRGRKPMPTEPITVAILPFQNVSAGESLDYLRSAIPDQVAHTLSTAHALTVRPLSASARFSDPGVDFRRIGHDLDVNRAITGHFLTVGDRLHITMEAVDTVEDRIIWHDSFEIASNNLLGMQEQIAVISRRQMANALGVREFISEAPPRATNEEAYELYLKSIALDWDPKPDAQAVELLRRAVLLDPNYAPAWRMLSLRYYGLARFGGGGPEMMAFSDAAAEKELALNPDSLDPIAEMTIHRTERGDLVNAHQIALELLRRKPDDPNLHHVLSYVLRYGGSLDEAGRQCELVVLLAAKVVWGSCSTTFMELGNYQRAKDFLRKDLSSEWSKAHAIEVLLREGKTDEAIRIPAPQIPHWDSYKMLLACALHESSDQIRLLASQVEVDDDPEVDYFFAGHLAYCGQDNAALQMLKVAIEHNYCSYPAMDIDPFFKRLRTDPQFQKLRLAAVTCHDDFVNNRSKRRFTVAKPSPSISRPS